MYGERTSSITVNIAYFGVLIPTTPAATGPVLTPMRILTIVCSLCGTVNFASNWSYNFVKLVIGYEMSSGNFKKGVPATFPETCWLFL